MRLLPLPDAFWESRRGIRILRFLLRMAWAELAIRHGDWSRIFRPPAHLIAKWPR